MISLISDKFSTVRAWHSAVVGGKDIILRHTSALEFLELFGGYMRESDIDVYAKEHGEYDNINYCVVSTFDSIDYIRYGDVLCTTASQTFNDMLEDYDNIDIQSLIEGLSGYYYSHNESFDGLFIKPENVERYTLIKDWAIEYYDEE